MQLVGSNFETLMKCVASRCPGGVLPDNYLVIDLETTGLPNKGREEYVTQFGYACVENRQIVDNYESLLKTPPGWINPEASRVTGITDEMIQKDGKDPKDFYQMLIELFGTVRQSEWMFVGHNIAKFDCPFLETDFKHYEHSFKFRAAEVIDTGMMFKASQIFASPADGESLGQFFNRVSQIRSRAKWNLVFTMKRMGLDMKYGLDFDKAHGAGFDCKMTHLLLEDLRQKAGLA